MVNVQFSSANTRIPKSKEKDIPLNLLTYSYDTKYLSFLPDSNDGNIDSEKKKYT